MSEKIVVFLLAVVIFLSACGAKTTPQTLSGEAREAVLAYSEGMTDNLLEGLNAGDYVAFSRDFTEQMKTSLSEAEFPDLSLQIIGTLGAYVSREIQSVEQTGDFVAVVYTAKFEQDDPVTVRVVFEVADPHLVTGLWFDSAKLRQK
ncbi:MAG: DUF3887 domain-containing protein [Anaerolineae bacterium]|nr:DUF3887 domain-containing protein [Anaerolineae bacterium]